MLSSQTIDIAIGLALVFLTLSVVVSAINELFSQILKTRFKGLYAALVSLLGSDAAQAVLAHPAIPAAPNGGKKQPSYIEPSYFAVALLDTVAPNADGAAKIKAILESPRDMAVGAAAADALVSFAKHSGGDYGTFVAHVSGWFDAYMDRVGGEYKRRAQAFALLVSLVVVAILDVDAVKAYRQLSTQPAFATALAANADAIVKQAQVGLSAATPTLGQSVDAIGTSVAQIPIPLGWHRSDWPPNLLKIIGLLISVIAGSLGAPFWFDVLGKLSNIRSSGVKPDPAAPQPPAAGVPPPAAPPPAPASLAPTPTSAS